MEEESLSYAPQKLCWTALCLLFFCTLGMLLVVSEMQQCVVSLDSFLAVSRHSFLCVISMCISWGWGISIYEVHIWDKLSLQSIATCFSKGFCLEGDALRFSLFQWWNCVIQRFPQHHQDLIFKIGSGHFSCTRIQVYLPPFNFFRKRKMLNGTWLGPLL